MCGVVATLTAERDDVLQDSLGVDSSFFLSALVRLYGWVGHCTGDMYVEGRCMWRCLGRQPCLACFVQCVKASQALLLEE
jgi:hypothetical protein